MNDDLLFANEEAHEKHIIASSDHVIAANQGSWKVLIADDEEEVHAMTKMVLKKFEFDGRKLELLSAYSGSETIAMMKEHSDIAILLLDVVMERDNSGLEVVKKIREELSNPFVRIILRTGQPGQAPEEDVIRHYDINDYKSKTELTVQKLYTSMIASLRAFKDMKTIEFNRIGLEHIVKSTRVLFGEKTIGSFSQAALQSTIELLGIDPDRTDYRGSGFIAFKKSGEYEIISAVGEYKNHLGMSVELTEASDFIKERYNDVGVNECCFVANRLLAKYDASDRFELVFYIEGNRNFNEFDRYLLQTFSSNLSIGFDNIFLNDEIIDTQREVIFTLGEIVETRSKETANHVRRVAEYSYILSVAAGLSEDESNLLRLASPMHDIGKIGIPDHILNKPGKLTPEEFEIIKSHTQIGFEILKQSNRKIMKTAATIAMQHHERWDGTGYPSGIAGENIQLLGRITSVADVFDALGHKRVYKDAWPESEILDYMKEQSGKMFDPRLVELLFENLESLNEIKQQYPD